MLSADSLPTRSIGLCGIDPQNLLQVDSTVLLHTRWVRTCGPGFSGEFTTAAIQDKGAGTFTAVVGAADSVRITSGGIAVTLRDGESATVTDLKVVAPGASLEAAKALLRRTGRGLEVFPRGP